MKIDEASARPPSLGSGSARLWRWICPLIFVATLLAYSPVLHAGFIWNDSDYVTAPELRSLHGLWRIWFEVGATQQYYPVLHSAFWLEHRLWGDAALGYHLINVLLHATAACLLVVVLKQFLEVRAASLAGLFFALHPVCVESVAWISEEKNTLSIVFYLLAALAYLRWREEMGTGGPPVRSLDQSFRSSSQSAEGTDGRAARPYLSSLYFLATLLFLLALLSKSVTATLPGALLIVGWWRRGRISWKQDVFPLIPWFILGAAVGLFTAWVERIYVGAHGAAYELSFVQRCLLAGRMTGFYLAKLAWPTDLIFIYPRWSIQAGTLLAWIPLVVAVTATAVLWRSAQLRPSGSAAAISTPRHGNRSRAVLAAWAFFCIGLFPVMGFFNLYAFRYSFVADHWQYLPCIGILVLAAALAAEFRITAIVVVGVLGILTWRQSRMYSDAETLYRTTLQRNPGCWMASHNLASLMLESGRTEEAVKQFEATLRIEPGFADSENNLGIALERLGRTDEAIAHLREAVRLEPDYAEADYNLGQALLDSRRYKEALGPLENAARLTPGFGGGFNALGLCLTRLDRPTDAAIQFEQSLRLEPHAPETHRNLGLALAMEDRWEEAIAQFQAAIRLRPDYADAHFRLALALWHVGRSDEAIAERQEALRLDPSLPQ